MKLVRGISYLFFEALQQLFEDAYKDEEFIDVMPFGSHPETRSVRASNMLRLALHRPGNGKNVIVLVVQDNLVKGASGQAVRRASLGGARSGRARRRPAPRPRADGHRPACPHGRSVGRCRPATHPTPRQVWGARLVKEGVVSASDVDAVDQVVLAERRRQFRHRARRVSEAARE